MLTKKYKCGKPFWHGSTFQQNDQEKVYAKVAESNKFKFLTCL